MRRSTQTTPQIARFTPPPVREEPDETDQWPDPQTLPGSAIRQAGASRLAALVLWTLILATLLVGVANLLRPVRVSTATPTVVQPSASSTITPPSGCAELVVSAWLSGNQALLGSLLGNDTFDGRAKTERQVKRVYTVASQVTADQIWSYTIGAEIVATTSTTTTQFFAVSLAKSSGGCFGWTALALPAQVPGPGSAGNIRLAYSRSLPITDTPLSETITRFLTTMLVDGDDLSRYTAPGANLTSVRPAPYTELRLSRLATSGGVYSGVPADGTRTQVLATVAVRVSGADGEWSLAYPLTLAVRGGRWEIAAIDASPETLAQSPSAAATASPALSGPSVSPSPQTSPSQK